MTQGEPTVHLAITLFVTTFVLVAFMSPLGAQQPPNIAGHWTGAVDTDRGTMDITVDITVDKGKASGTITTGHGQLVIANGTYANDKWRLPFSGHGMKGEMVGTIKGDAFDGVWDNSPVATGSVKLKRSVSPSTPAHVDHTPLDGLPVTSTAQITNDVQCTS